jgi:hypothetical protein
MRTLHKIGVMATPYAGLIDFGKKPVLIPA